MSRPIIYKERELMKLGSWSLTMDRKGYIVSGPGFNQFFGTFTRAYLHYIDGIARDELMKLPIDDKMDAMMVIKKVYQTHEKLLSQMEHAYALPFYYDIDREMNQIRRELDEIINSRTGDTEDKGPGIEDISVSRHGLFG